MSTTSHFIALWQEARTRFNNQLTNIQSEDLLKTLGDSPNSAGFLLRHLAEVELLFAKNVFGDASIKITAKTVIDKRDTGEWTDLPALLTLLNQAHNKLLAVLQGQSEVDWSSEVHTQEFGTKTKAEALGRIVSHTAYHAGQLSIVLKYGKQ